MKIALKFPLIALAAWMIFTLAAGTSTAEVLVKLGLFLVTAALAYGWWKSRHVGQPKMNIKEFPAAEKAWLKSARKAWITDFDSIGFVRWHPAKNQSLPDQAQAPRLLSCQPVPLGIEMGIEILSGHQTQADWIAASEKLASAWERPLRISKGQNPRHVLVLVEFASPLDEARDSVDNMTEDDWDTKEVRNA